jgi:hypothetical protein
MHRGSSTGVLLLGCVVAAACSGRDNSVRSVLYDPANPLPPRPADAAVHLLADHSPECPYEPIATIAVESRGELPSRETTDAMARETRRIGGDGIMRFTVERGTMRGTAFRFTNPSCTR